MKNNKNTSGTGERARGVISNSWGCEARSPIVFSGWVVHYFTYTIYVSKLSLDSFYFCCLYFCYVSYFGCFEK